jgi:hypothetical protein
MSGAGVARRVNSACACGDRANRLCSGETNVTNSFMTTRMSVRREVLVFVILGACAWFIGLGVSQTIRDAEGDRSRMQVIERDTPVAFDIRNAG